jgi:hypothetical protein
MHRSYSNGIGLDIQLNDNPPFATSPFLSAVNILNVWRADSSPQYIPPNTFFHERADLLTCSERAQQRPTETPLIWRHGSHIQESSSLLTGSAMSSKQRRQFFSSRERRLATTLSKEYIYAFDLYTSHLDITKKKVYLGFSYDAGKYIGDQPITYTLWSKNKSKTILSISFDRFETKHNSEVNV